MTPKTLLGIGTCVAILTGCAQTPPPFDSRPIVQQEIQAAREAPTSELPALPTTLVSPLPPPQPGESHEQTPRVPPATQPFTEPTTRLTLQEIIHRTVANNSDVRVAGYDTAIDANRIIEAESRFDPTVFANYQHQRQTNPFGFPSSLSNPQRLDTDQAQGGIRQNFETGTQVELRYQTQRSNLDPAGLSVNPFYQNEVVLQITQPLLQNFGTDVNRARITIARNDRKISLLDFRQKLEQTLLKAEQAYWQAVQAESELHIQERLLDRTIETGKIIWGRFGQDVSNVQLSQINATIEARRTLLVRTRARLEELSDQLKRFMSDPQYPIASPLLVLPGDEPAESPIRFVRADQIRMAMENRAELIQQQLRIDSAGTVVSAAQNNLLPQLNLQGQVGLIGLGDSWNNATSSQGDGDFIDYTVGFTFEVPIGNRGPRAIWQRTLLQRQQAIEQYRALVDQISLDVTSAQREVETSWREFVAARQARLNAAESLRTIEERQRGEKLDPTFLQLVLDRQASLAETERTESAAKVSYNLAISALEQAKGTLLRYNNVVLEEDRLPAFVGSNR